MQACMQPWGRGVVAVLVGSVLGTGAPIAMAQSVVREWPFEARLDGRLIGEHRFVLTETGDQRQLQSEASFTVRLLGLVVYRYQHTAQERWRGDCLTAMESRTNDDGKAQSVRAQAVGDGSAGLRVTVSPGEAAREVPGCTMGFAYWNPALRRQTQLINVQTGRLEPVQVERMVDGNLEARGATVPAERWRIRTQDQTIDVWYATQGGEWIGLDAQVRGGRQLSYRLPPRTQASTPTSTPTTHVLR